jgi:adenylosuccinate synthase
MRARAVIGANYGDEGKGRTVDSLAAQSRAPALVVRSNGGAQAGHSVAMQDGQRYVFHHLGSASLRGAATHFSRFMVSHPVLFEDELSRLCQMGARTAVSADPRGYVTTPWDMMINQALETARDGQSHGSCGLGFSETVGRCEATDYGLHVSDLKHPGLLEKLLVIRDEWLPHRLAALDLSAVQGPLEFAGSEKLMDHFIEQCAFMVSSVTFRDDGCIGDSHNVVFEGAQGLLLDQNAADFPYVTRSNTGITNIAAIMAEAGIEALDVLFVTRCCLTRHGCGPMEDEQQIDKWFDVDDPTNQTNPWQETLRFGLLDPASLGKRIATDLAGLNLDCSAGLALTCLDQARDNYAWLEDGRVAEGALNVFVDAITAESNPPLAVAFSSPVNELSTIKMQNVF